MAFVVAADWIVVEWSTLDFLAGLRKMYVNIFYKIFLYKFL